MWSVGVFRESVDLLGSGDDGGSVNGVGVFVWDARFPGAFGWSALMVRRLGTFLGGEGGGA